jgi:hypothetical protein
LTLNTDARAAAQADLEAIMDRWGARVLLLTNEIRRVAETEREGEHDLKVALHDGKLVHVDVLVRRRRKA